LVNHQVLNMEKKSVGERLETFIYNESSVEHLHRYGIAKDLIKGKTVLDIACGEGYGSFLMAEEAAEVVGIDIDGTTIQHAAKKYKRANLRFKQGQVEKINEADQSFDVVVSFETLEHIEDHEKMFREIKRVLKTGGIVIVSTPDKKFYSDQPGYNNPFHKKELYEEQFKDLIRRFFDYSYFLYQRLMLVSAIVLEQESSLRFYKGDYDKIVSADKMEPVYIIAIASDRKIEKPFSSLFSSEGILQTAIRQKEQDMRKTWSYRIGHLILFPFKIIRGLLKK